jgi:hypothetical protein
LERRRTTERDRKEKELLNLKGELKMVTDTIDKLTNKRVLLLTKIHMLKQELNGSN